MLTLISHHTSPPTTIATLPACLVYLQQIPSPKSAIPIPLSVHSPPKFLLGTSPTHHPTPPSQLSRLISPLALICSMYEIFSYDRLAPPWGAYRLLHGDEQHNQKRLGIRAFLTCEDVSYEKRLHIQCAQTTISALKRAMPPQHFVSALSRTQPHPSASPVPASMGEPLDCYAFENRWFLISHPKPMALGTDVRSICTPDSSPRGCTGRQVRQAGRDDGVLCHPQSLTPASSISFLAKPQTSQCRDDLPSPEPPHHSSSSIGSKHHQSRANVPAPQSRGHRNTTQRLHHHPHVLHLFTCSPSPSNLFPTITMMLVLAPQHASSMHALT